MSEHLYLVAYDIADEKRWRRVWKTMNGFGQWLQLSVFQCRLTRQKHAELIAQLDGIMNKAQDHIVIMDLGPAEGVEPRVVSMGKDFKAVMRAAVIV